MPLYLAGAEMLAGPEIEAELRPTLPRRSSLAMAFLHAGIDLRLFRDDAQVVLLRPQRVLPAAQLTAQAIDLELAQMSEAAFFFRGLPQAGSLFFHPPQEVRVPSFDQKVAIKSSSALLLTQAVPSGMQNRQRFAESLAAHDAQILIDGGWMLPLGQEEATQRFAAAFRQLPPVRFSRCRRKPCGPAGRVPLGHRGRQDLCLRREHHALSGQRPGPPGGVAELHDRRPLWRGRPALRPAPPAAAAGRPRHKIAAARSKNDGEGSRGSSS